MLLFYSNMRCCQVDGKSDWFPHHFYALMHVQHDNVHMFPLNAKVSLSYKVVRFLLCTTYTAVYKKS